jgi:hypothetical protein
MRSLYKRGGSPAAAPAAPEDDAADEEAPLRRCGEAGAKMTEVSDTVRACLAGKGEELEEREARCGRARGGVRKRLAWCALERRECAPESRLA